jgi:CDP-diglyceride synthetase
MKMLKRVNRRVNLLGLIFILVVIQIFSFNTLKSIFARDYHIKDVQILALSPYLRTK